MRQKSIDAGKRFGVVEDYMEHWFWDSDIYFASSD